MKREEYIIKSLEYKWRLNKLMAAAKNRAKEKVLPFNLTLDYLVSLWEASSGCCVLTRQPFDLSSWGNKSQVSPQAPSIDRIKPSLGYIKENIRLVTYHINISLSDFGEEEFKKLIAAYQDSVAY